jgi:hypothetical protein
VNDEKSDTSLSHDGTNPIRLSCFSSHAHKSCQTTHFILNKIFGREIHDTIRNDKLPVPSSTRIVVPFSGPNRDSESEESESAGSCSQ